MTNASNIIVKFIRHFAGSEDTFLHGCCYWFAWILQRRFGATIMYEPVEGHFVGAVDGRMYDIRGDVSDLYSGKELYSAEWLMVNEPRWYSHLLRDCRDFIEPYDQELEKTA